MLKINRCAAGLVLLIIASVSATSCMPGVRMNTEGAKETEVTGTYRAILHGCNYLDDLMTVAFLQKEGAKYPFEPYAPDFNFRAREGLPAKEALEAAGKFLDCNTSFRNSQLRRIVTPEGDVLGYEVKPLYHIYAYGMDEPLHTDYRLRDGKIIIRMWVDPSVEKMLSGGTERSMNR